MEKTETNIRVYRVHVGAINPLKTKQTHKQIKYPRLGAYNVIHLSSLLNTLYNSTILPQIIPAFRNSDPVAFFDSYLMEIKIILTHHLAHKNMPDIPQDFTLI